MSGEGREEPLGGAGTGETRGSPSHRVPSQGGAAGGGSGAAGSPGGTPRTGARDAEAQDPRAQRAGGESGTGVPAQRTGGFSGSVLPPPIELPPPDAVLVRRMRDGDDTAYEELFRRHAEAVRRYARTCCRDGHTADDLTAEVFARTLQAVRGGAGPEHAVRAYLLTTVRRVAAAWARTARREQLVEDFAVFAAQATRTPEVSGEGTVEVGADVRAMHAAERSLAMQAFRSLPERWQAVLWHTTVEEESPSEVAPLFGLTANATAVLASRAREGLKQAYLQAHVSRALTSGGDCARYADRLGAYARGGLRTRAERGLRKHLEECAACRLAAGELQQVNAGIPALLPVAVIGWFATGASLDAAGAVAAGGAVGAVGAAGAAAAAGAGAGGAAGAGAGAGASTGAGAGAGGSVAEGMGVPAKAGIAAAVAVAAAAGLVWALAGGPRPVPPEPQARPPRAEPAVPREEPPGPAGRAPSPTPTAAPAAPPPAPSRSPAPSRAPAPSTTPADRAPAPPPAPAPTPTRRPAPPPAPPPAPAPASTPAPPPPPATYQLNTLRYGLFGDHTAPEVRLHESGWLWQRWGMSIAGERYGHGVTVHATSSVTIDLNRRCSTYDAFVGVDDLALGLGGARFSVYGDGDARLWRSSVVRGGDAAVPAHVGIAGHRTIRLVVEPHTAAPLGRTVPVGWAEARIGCG